MKKNLTLSSLLGLFMLFSISAFAQNNPCTMATTVPVTATADANLSLSHSFTGVPVGTVIELITANPDDVFNIELCSTNADGWADGDHDSSLHILDGNGPTANHLLNIEDGCTNGAGPNFWGPDNGSWGATAMGTYYLYITEWNAAGNANCEITSGQVYNVNINITSAGPCEAGVITSATTQSVCPGESFDITTDGSEVSDGGFELGIDNTNTAGTGGTGNPIRLINLTAASFPLSYDASLNTILPNNNLPNLDGTWEFTVYALDAAGNDCDSTGVVTVTFLPDTDPSCTPAVCEAGVLTSAATQTICTGETFDITLDGTQDATELTLGFSNTNTGGTGGTEGPIQITGYTAADFPITHDETISGILPANNLPNLAGTWEIKVYALDFSGNICDSTAITTVTINEPLGGTISTNDPTTICAGDGVADPINVTLAGEIGTSSSWVITDQAGEILGLPAGPPFDLDGAGAGTCLIWHMSSYGTVTGAMLGNNATTDLVGCYSLSNPITVTRNEPTTGSETYSGVIGDGYSVTVNGTMYNEGMPTGTEVLTNSVGCDSTVTVNLVFSTCDPSVCTTPQNVNAVAETNFRIGVTFDPVPNAIRYQVRYRIVGTTSWTHKTVLASQSFIKFPTTALASYQYQVRSRCCNDTWTTWSTMDYLNASACDVPVGISASVSTGANGPIVTISYIGDPNETNTRAAYRPIGTTTWSEWGHYPVGSPGTIVISAFQGLVENTTYEYRLHSTCNTGGFTYWSAIGTFTTGAAMKLNVSNITATGIYPNPAKNELNVNSTFKNAGDVTINITNLMGQTVRENNLTVQSEERINEVIDIKDLNAGLYILSISSGDEIVTHKFMKK